MRDKKQALKNLHVGVRQEQGAVAGPQYIFTTKFTQRRDSQRRAELTRIKGERGAETKHAGLWWDNIEGDYVTVGVQLRHVADRQGCRRG